MWWSNLTNTMGDSVSEHQKEGDMSMKLINSDGVVPYSYVGYNTPNNEVYDFIFKCVQAFCE